jgi:hypothetical protein
MNRAAALRVSLLVSMGLVPIACGGTAMSSGDDDENEGGGSGNGGRAGVGASGALGGKASAGGAGGKAGSASKAGAGSAAEGGTETGGATNSGGAPGRACTNGRLETLSGLLRCAEGYWARPTAKECELPVGLPAAEGGAGGQAPGPLPRANGAACDVDDDCRQFELGYCREGSACDQGFGGQSGSCASGCGTDADCGPGYICLCDGSTHGGECVRSSCGTDEDCVSGMVCASLGGFDEYSFSCTTAQDECATSADCNDSESCEQSGVRRECQELAVCGRPFLVANAARLAPVTNDETWTEGAAITPQLDHLTASERVALTAHWTKLGRMEHASIAAFARFGLQLLALGAPPDLLEDCTRALADETAHTKLCFALASAYAGRPIGPGPLDIASSLDVTSLADIVELVLAEGCFGETSAALEALEAADSERDPVVAAAYAQIAADEQRHAELAFRFVRWALGRDASSVRQRLHAAIARPPSSTQAARDVTLPCLRALLARGRSEEESRKSQPRAELSAEPHFTLT